ncbi:transcription termination/antitermination protein NusG [Planctomicrobium sp. SH664]|uniref:transcription termination/antitermination protein NusG n=1 Tax=Planctomicrobium sp. SH664 TaxID=3448125 RepID=UPI003F5B4D44
MRGSLMDDQQSSSEIKPESKAKPKGRKAAKPERSIAERLGTDNPRMRWFVLKVQSNRERSIRDSIIRRIKMEGMEDHFGEIFIPTEKVVETKGGGRRVREQKLLPGYMMIQMDLTDESWHLVRSTGGVGDFTGAAGKPIPMEIHEVRRWLGLEEEVKPGEPEKPSKPVVKFDVSVADHVKVKEGAFESFEGSVDSMDDTTGKVKVIIEIFGRPTEVELEHWQVEKV